MIYTLIIFTTVFLVWEAWYDRQLANQFDADGNRSKVENSLMHGAQLVPRGIFLMSLTLYTPLLIDKVLVFIFLSAYYWLAFDILYNKWVLKVAWNRIGETSKVEVGANEIYVFFVKISRYFVRQKRKSEHIKTPYTIKPLNHSTAKNLYVLLKIAILVVALMYYLL